MTTTNGNLEEWVTIYASLLLQRIGVGDTNAWDQFVELSHRLIFHWCRQSFDAPEAERISQAVYARIADESNSIAQARPFHWLRDLVDSEMAANSLGDESGVRGEESEAMRLNRGEGGMELQFLLEPVMKRMQSLCSETDWRLYVETAVKGRPVNEVATESGVAAGRVYVAQSQVRRVWMAEFGGAVGEVDESRPEPGAAS